MTWQWLLRCLLRLQSLFVVPARKRSPFVSTQGLAVILLLLLMPWDLLHALLLYHFQVTLKSLMLQHLLPSMLL
jgi:hypothetical protein